MNIETSSHLFPLGYQQRRPYHFNTIQTIDYNFRFLKYQLSVVAYLATILRIKSPVRKFKPPWRLKWSQLGGLSYDFAPRWLSLLSQSLSVAVAIAQLLLTVNWKKLYLRKMKWHWMHPSVKWCNDPCLATGEGTTSSWKFNRLYEPSVNAKLTFLVLILILSFLSFFLTLTLDISGTRYYNKMKLTLA